MAQFGVDLKFTSAKAEQALKRLSGGTKKVQRDVGRLQGKVGRSLNSSFRKVGSTGRSAVNGIGDAFRDATRKAKEFGRAAKEAGKQAARSIAKSKTARAVGAGAAFSNAPGAGLIGAGAAGALAFGGPKGAAIGVASKLFIDGTLALSRFGKEAAIVTAQNEKLKIALKGVAGSGYEEALNRLNQVNKKYNNTTAETIQGFTQTLAGAKSANVSLEDALKTYEGLTVANKALGGTQDDLNGILRAATQIFSKNKVQAEELRGQIGDRLPGAFGQFAKATGMSTQELDKAMTDGKISVRDFVKFATSFLGPDSDFEKAAKNISDSPSEAGRRLNVAMNNLKTTLGPLTKAIGALFQDMASESMKALSGLATMINGITLKLAEFRLNKSIRMRDDLQDKVDSAREQGRFGKNAGNLAIMTETLERLKKRADKDQDFVNILRGKPDSKSGGAPFSSGSDSLVDTNAGSTSTPKTDNLVELGERIRLLERIAPIQDNINIALLEGDQLTAARLEGEKALVEEIFAGEAAVRALNTEEGKALQDRINTLDLEEILRQNAQDQLVIQQELTKARKDALRPLTEQTELLEAQLEGRGDEVGLLQEAARIAQSVEGLEEAEVLAILKKNKALQEQLDTLAEMKQMAAELSGVIANGLVDGLQGVVDGSTSAREALANMINSTADLFLQRASEMIAKAIEAQVFSLIQGLFGPPSPVGGATDGLNTRNMTGFFNPGAFRADGGPVTSGTPYIVGERGPEIVVPNQSGTVLSNQQSRNAMDYYGGGQSGGGTFRLETTVINGVEYATVDQVRAMGSQAAKQGAASGNAMTMSQLRNSRTQRSKLGMR